MIVQGYPTPRCMYNGWNTLDTVAAKELMFYVYIKRQRHAMKRSIDLLLQPLTLECVENTRNIDIDEKLKRDRDLRHRSAMTYHLMN